MAGSIVGNQLLLFYGGRDALIKLAPDICACACRVLVLSDSVVEENLQWMMVADGKIHNLNDWE